MAKNPEDIKNEREQGGIEYAVMRSSDGALLWDDDLNGVYQSWEDDEENASWVDSEKVDWQRCVGQVLRGRVPVR